MIVAKVVLERNPDGTFAVLLWNDRKRNSYLEHVEEKDLKELLRFLTGLTTYVIVYTDESLSNFPNLARVFYQPLKSAKNQEEVA